MKKYITTKDGTKFKRSEVFTWILEDDGELRVWLTNGRYMTFSPLVSYVVYKQLIEKDEE